jgi:hypothetical protein
MRREHNHAEAFKKMCYTSDDGTEQEWIWNSRDGITPFVITLRSGKTAVHTHWELDEYLPSYQPKVGERVFIDMTPELCKKITTDNVDKWIEDTRLQPSILDAYGTRENAIEQLSKFRPGAPALIEITEERRHSDIKPPEASK